MDPRIPVSRSAAPGPDFRARLVAEVMRRRWISLSREATLFEAERLMRLARIRELPVVAGSILLGVVSYRELLRRSLESPMAAASGTVGDLMGSSPPTIEPSAPLALAAERIVVARVACLPVVEPLAAGPSIVGLVTEADLLRTAYEAFVAGAGG